MARYLYSELANLVQARKACLEKYQNSRTQAEADGHNQWYQKHCTAIETLVTDHMPSGAGFDSGTELDTDKSHADKLVFTTSYHHMAESGMYDGWTQHTVVVTPSLIHRFNIRISGRNRNDIKEYMYEVFRSALETDITYDLYKDQFGGDDTC